jgi:hypothetical protein
MVASTAVDYGSGFDDYSPGYYGGSYTVERQLKLNVFDVRDLSGGLSVVTVDVAEDWLNNGFGSSFDNVQLATDNGYQQSLIAGGNLVVSQHRVDEQDGSGYRYFAERLDLTNPAEPQWLEPVNIPGQALALADDDVHLVTLDSVEVPVDEAECFQSAYDDYIVCHNRMIELSSLTLETERAVREAKVRLGSNRISYRVALDGAAVYVQDYDYEVEYSDTLAYSYGVQPLGTLAADQYPGYLTAWFGAPVLVNYQGDALTAVFLSTQSGAVAEAARADDVRCQPAAVGEVAVYCAAGYNGVVASPLE